MIKWTFVLSAALLAAACGGSSSPSLATPPAGSPCDVSVANTPLPMIHVDPNEPPPPSGGVIADGTYDLVEMRAPCDNEQNGRLIPARVALRFTTTDRSSNQFGGTLAAGGAKEAAPATCEVGTFMAFQQLLDVRGVKDMGAVPYTATRDGRIILYTPDGGRCDVKHIVFKRR